MSGFNFIRLGRHQSWIFTLAKIFRKNPLGDRAAFGNVDAFAAVGTDLRTLSLRIELFIVKIAATDRDPLSDTTGGTALFGTLADWTDSVCLRLNHPGWLGKIGQFLSYAMLSRQ